MNWKFWQKGPEKPSKPKSKAREWWDAILFAVIAATLIRWLIMEAYTIPTPSMENSLLVGDFLFVSKFHYGTRTTTTPLQVPLTHQKIWFTNIPSYVEWIKLPQYRLPGFTEVKNGDVVVFNIPPRDLNEGRDYPVDLKTNYIKRCVGIGGDILEIKNQDVYINGKAFPKPPAMQYSYAITSNSVINERNLKKYGLGPEDWSMGHSSDGKLVYYSVHLTDEMAKQIMADKPAYILDIHRELSDTKNTFPYDLRYNQVFNLPRNPNLAWSQDNFGPLWIPKEGASITINDSTLTLYGNVIMEYDHNEEGSVKIENGKLFIDGSEMKEYTFKQNYYFMMGDNRHNSLDSRYWGFVPEDHVVGKAFFIWLSIDSNAGFFNKIRWSRFFNLIE
jgi:signal peptidase I